MAHEHCAQRDHGAPDGQHQRPGGGGGPERLPQDPHPRGRHDVQLLLHRHEGGLRPGRCGGRLADELRGLRQRCRHSAGLRRLDDQILLRRPALHYGGAHGGLPVADESGGGKPQTLRHRVTKGGTLYETTGLEQKLAIFPAGLP